MHTCRLWINITHSEKRLASCFFYFLFSFFFHYLFTYLFIYRYNDSLNVNWKIRRFSLFVLSENYPWTDQYLFTTHLKLFLKSTSIEQVALPFKDNFRSKHGCRYIAS
jgi:hypothetical protein